MFRIFTNDSGNLPPFERLPAAAATYNAGDALTVSSGKLALATGTTKPSYIAQESATKTDGALLTCVRVSPLMLIKTSLGVSGTLTAGSKYTIHTDGGQITATSTSGVFEVVRAEGSAVGSAVYGRFS